MEIPSQPLIHNIIEFPLPTKLGPRSRDQLSCREGLLNRMRTKMKLPWLAYYINSQCNVRIVFLRVAVQMPKVALKTRGRLCARFSECCITWKWEETACIVLYTYRIFTFQSSVALVEAQAEDQGSCFFDAPNFSHSTWAASGMERAKHWYSWLQESSHPPKCVSA